MAFQMESHKGGLKEIKAEHYVTKISDKEWSATVPMAPAAPISGWIHYGVFSTKKAALVRVQKYLDIACPKREL